MHRRRRTSIKLSKSNINTHLSVATPHMQDLSTGAAVIGGQGTQIPAATHRIRSRQIGRDKTTASTDDTCFLLRMHYCFDGRVLNTKQLHCLLFKSSCLAAVHVPSSPSVIILLPIKMFVKWMWLMYEWIFDREKKERENGASCNEITERIHVSLVNTVLKKWCGLTSRCGHFNRTGIDDFSVHFWKLQQIYIYSERAQMKS